MEILRLKYDIVGGLLWAVERAVWKGEALYEELSGYRADLKRRYYSAKVREQRHQEVLLDSTTVI